MRVWSTARGEVDRDDEEELTKEMVLKVEKKAEIESHGGAFLIITNTGGEAMDWDELRVQESSSKTVRPFFRTASGLLRGE